jgi:hypothetical protein
MGSTRQFNYSRGRLCHPKRLVTVASKQGTGYNSKSFKATFLYDTDSLSILREETDGQG